MPTLSPLGASAVVVMTTPDGISNNKVGIMTSLSVRCSQVVVMTTSDASSDGKITSWQLSVFRAFIIQYTHNAWVSCLVYLHIQNLCRVVACKCWWMVHCICECMRDDFNTLRPRQNGCRFADDTFKRIFLNENVRIWIKISLKFVPDGPINKIAALV